MNKTSAAMLSYATLLLVFLLGLLVWPSDWLNPKSLLLYVGAITASFWFSMVLFGTVLRSRRLQDMQRVVAVLLLVPLVATLVLGEVRYGSKRWLFGVQTSELAKLLLVPSLYASTWAYLGFGVLAGLLVILQPDLGTGVIVIFSVLVAWFIGRFKLNERTWTAILCTVAGIAVFFASSMRLRQFVAALLLQGSNGMLHGHWVERILNWADPLRDPFGDSFQTLAGLTSLAYSASFGKGVGSMFVLPVSWADYAFAELVRHGSILLGILVLALIGVLLYLLFEYGSPMKYYVGSLLMLHVLVNLYSIANVIPATGVPFPFVGRALQNTCVLAALVGGAFGQS